MKSYLWLAITISVLAISSVLLKQFMSGGSYHGTEKMTGKTVIITGANTGIGKETSQDLASRGARVIMACRDEDKCEAARKDIIKATGNNNVAHAKLDLSSFASIRNFAQDILKAEPRIDVLINNAGVMMCPKSLTEDGLEMHMGVNHFGPFLLTNLLLDKIKASAPSRILIVASRGHVRGSIDFEDLNSEKSYNPLYVYCNSKVANILHANELAKRLEGTGVTVNSLHPGIVNTEILRHMPYIGGVKVFEYLLYPIKYIFFKNSFQGSQTSIRLAVDPKLEKVTGKYFSDCVEKDPAPQALDEAVAKKLFEVSEKVTNSKA